MTTATFHASLVGRWDGGAVGWRSPRVYFLAFSATTHGRSEPEGSLTARVATASQVSRERPRAAPGPGGGSSRGRPDAPAAGSPPGEWCPRLLSPRSR